MKLNSAPAKDILAQIGMMKVGEKAVFGSVLPGFKQAVDAHLTETEPGKFWQFALYWNSVFIQDVVLAIKNDELLVESLGAR